VSGSKARTHLLDSLHLPHFFFQILLFAFAVLVKVVDVSRLIALMAQAIFMLLS
jgi:hypothetical protein